MKKTLLLSLLLSLAATFVQAQEIDKIVTWKFKFANDNFKVGDEVELIFDTTIEKGWSLYSSDFKGDVGPQPTIFQFSENGSFELSSDIKPISPLKKTDRNWGTEISYFTQKAQFRAKVRVVEYNYDIFGSIKGQVCHDKKGVCIPFEKTFQF
ncbi:protein-disulfide reductase DsbD domain-containing protein [Flectobacillus major]|jgi:thiol:disulfide interchange protein DsbD|uniref:protein-disulfide reductase DsbD domain-containing protein n=1 Tax=Flectobacillus major TaxID=103 RepID=UPI0004089527|nr:protein-disulfide reductase DsbD domain-containing protein [Flectobacillus major]